LPRYIRGGGLALCSGSIRQAALVPPGNSIVLLTCPFRLRGWCGDGNAHQ
jgi:hypothetical protein